MTSRGASRGPRKKISRLAIARHIFRPPHKLFYNSPLLTTIWRDQKRLHCSCIRNAWIFSCFIILLSINHFTISRLNWHKRLELPRERTVIVEVLLRFCYYKLTNLKIWPIQICLSRIDLFFNCYLPILYECGTRFHDCSINVTVSMSIEQTITRRKQFC